MLQNGKILIMVMAVQDIEMFVCTEQCLPIVADVFFNDLSMAHDNSRKTLISDVVKSNLKTLIGQHSNGLWCCELPKLYLNLFHCELDYKDFGYINLIQMLSELTDIFRCVRPTGDDWLVFDASLPPSLSEMRITEETPKNNLQCSHAYYVYPNDVMKLEDQLVHPDLKDLFLNCSRMEVCAAEVWSPSHFYIHLKKFKNHLDVFMDDLQKFYNASFREYKVPEWAMRPKQVCVGHYSTDSSTPEEWHRLEILQVLSHKSVFVYLVDYGTTAVLKKNQLRFLHKTFQFFPVQGIRAKLANLSPVKPREKWPAAASLRFLELLRVPFLEADVVDYESNEPKLCVILYDTSHSVSINTQLINENLAEKAQDKVEISGLSGTQECCVNKLEVLSQTWQHSEEISNSRS